MGRPRIHQVTRSPVTFSADSSVLEEFDRLIGRNERSEMLGKLMKLYIERGESVFDAVKEEG